MSRNSHPGQDPDQNNKTWPVGSCSSRTYFLLLVTILTDQMQHIAEPQSPRFPAPGQNKVILLRTLIPFLWASVHCLQYISAKYNFIQRPGDLALAGRFGSGREIWLWPGDLALSCNPSYLGGQSSGMAWGGHTSPGRRIDFWVRINGFCYSKWPWCCPEAYVKKLGLDTLPLRLSKMVTVRDSTNTVRPCSILYCMNL
jgi:hypothetical protein